VVEGVELIREAMTAGIEPQSVFLAAEGHGDPGAAAVVALAVERGVRVHELASGVIARVADTVTPQPVMAVFAIRPGELATLAGGRLVVVLDDVRDPGNAGTVLRTAEAAGADGVVFGGGTVDPYNPKTVRASAGSIFHTNVVVEPDIDRALESLADLGYRRLGAVVRGAQDYTTVDWLSPVAVVLGNESSGLGGSLPLDGTVGIPMTGKSESLNVAMACAVLCFEAQRQRRLDPLRSRSTMPR